MVKKLKAMAKDADEGNQLAAAIRESAQQIWLAGLGAFAKAQQEGGKVFDALVREGTGLQKRTRDATGDRIGDVTGRVGRAASEIQRQATESWDRLEQVFEERVARALTRLGVPTHKELEALVARVETMNAMLQAMSDGAAGQAQTVGRRSASRKAIANGASDAAAATASTADGTGMPSPKRARAATKSGAKAGATSGATSGAKTAAASRAGASKGSRGTGGKSTGSARTAAATRRRGAASA